MTLSPSLVVVLLLSAAAGCQAFVVPPRSSTIAVRNSNKDTMTTLLRTVTGTASDSSTGVTVNEDPTPVPHKDEFDWFKAWYPLVPVEYLDPEIPHHYTLLGMDLVVWNDGKVPGASFQSKKDRP